jgi:outer membrane receptor protein involved in Fe transport
LVQRTFWLATAALAVLATPALAQQPKAAPGGAAKSPSAPKPAAGGTVGEIVVEGTPPPIRNSIDRNSYSVANDLQATTGSISDALRSVPSVEVDVQGNVALRGDTNVTIMIDGKPSGMFQGDGKAQALQNLPADQIERVEVITNPSAAFDPNGSAGIINLITKKTRKLGPQGSMRANVGSSGRQNGGISGSYRDQKLTLSGDASYRHDSIKQDFSRERETPDLVAGGVRRSEQDGVQGGRVNVASVRGQVDYDPDAKTRFTAELRYLSVDFMDESSETLREVSGVGVPTRDYVRLGQARQKRPTEAGTLRFRHTFGDEHELTADFTRERSQNHFDRQSSYDNRLGPDSYEALSLDTLFWETLGKVEYSRPLPGDVKLKLGYSYDADDNDYDNRGERGPAPGLTSPDPSLTNLFKFDQQVHAVYGTYERPFGRLTALGGLRVEAVNIDIHSVTQNLKAGNDDASLYPSLHLRYSLTEDQNLSASYSHRIQRPQPQDYNPFRIYQDPQNFRAGNPDLKPQQTHSYELGYQYRKAGTIYLATLYYRDIRDAVTDVTRNIGGGVFLSTKENIGQSRNAGLELVANGKLTPKLSYNVNGNLFWNEIDGEGLGFGASQRDAVSLAGRANLSWTVTDKDFVQINGLVNGKRLTPQGYMQPTAMLNLGYRHKFSDQLSGVVTIQDALDSFRFKSVIDTPTLRDVQRFTPTNRGVFVGFTYAFGGGKARDGFDFGGGAGPTP